MVLSPNFAPLTAQKAIALLKSNSNNDLASLQQMADQIRKQQVGNIVTYVINRNINFTNICEQHCSFCAFRRDATEAGAFWLSLEDILAKSAEALQRGATEICMQGGLNPQAQIMSN